MKKILLVALTVFSTALLLSAQEATPASEGTPMTGWICSSKCVVQQGDHATCDQSCTESGSPVFVSDNGTVTKISKKVSNVSKENMGKHVNMKATMDDQGEINSLVYGGG